MRANQALSGRDVKLSFCSSASLQAPKDDWISIPVVIRTPPREIGSALVYDIVFNGKVLERAEKDEGFRDELVGLAYDCLKSERTHPITCRGPHQILPPLASDESQDARQKSAPNPSNVQPKPFEQVAQPELPAFLAPFVISPPAQSRQPPPSSSSSIEVTAPNTVENTPRTHSNGLPVPEHHVDVNVVERLVTVKVVLPGVESVGEIDVEPGQQAVSITVPGKYAVLVPLPRPITEDGSKAKFVRSKHTLNLTFPFA